MFDQRCQADDIAGARRDPLRRSATDGEAFAVEIDERLRPQGLDEPDVGGQALTAESDVLGS